MNRPNKNAYRFWLALFAGILLGAGCENRENAGHEPEAALNVQAEQGVPEREKAGQNAQTAAIDVPFTVVEEEKTGVPETLETQDATQQYYRAKIAEGMRLEEAGKLDDASTIYELLTVEFPARFDAFHRLARVHEQKNDAEMAHALYEETMRQNPTSAAFFNDFGWFLLSIGELQDAYGCLQKANSMTPDSPKYMMNLAICITKMGRYPEAFLQFKKAANGNSAVAYTNLAAIQYEDGKLPAAKESIQKALTADPKEKRALELRTLIEEAERFQQEAFTAEEAHIP